MSKPVKIISKLLKFEQSPVWGRHLVIPNEVAVNFIEGKDRRIICIINGTEKLHCALMPDGNGGFFMMINKALCKKLKINLGDDIQLEISKDNSKYGMEMPEELGSLLELDENGNRIFHELTPGKQRNLIHMVAKYKNYETRVNKAIVIVDYLKDVNGKLDFKELMAAFKNHKPI